MGRRVFDRRLARIKDDVLILGSMVEEALVAAVDSLKRRDFQVSERIIAADREVNGKRFAIEADVLALIATQQPVACDMRFLAAAIEIVTELERIGDYAKGIAKINLLIGAEPLLKPLVDLPQMASEVRGMLRRALEAYIWRDVRLAREIPDDDDAVDRLYRKIDRDLLELILADPSPKTIDRANNLLWAAHNLERAADRVVNICERVVFTETGEMVEMNITDGRFASEPKKH
jgi:phosphate transport system protein